MNNNFTGVATANVPVKENEAYERRMEKNMDIDTRCFIIGFVTALQFKEE